MWLLEEMQTANLGIKQSFSDEFGQWRLPKHYNRVEGAFESILGATQSKTQLFGLFLPPTLPSLNPSTWTREAPEEVGLWVCATPREGRLSLCLSGMALLRASFNTNSQNRQKYSLAHVRASVKQSSCISQVSITVTKHQDR